MPNPIYDVVIPIYKVQPEWIVECLDSVLAQKIQAWRVIIVDGTPLDDDMADAIAAVCLLYVNSDPRFHYLRQDADVEGVGGARNQAIAYGNSPWVAFLDADDYWYPEKLEKQMKFLEENPKVGILGTQLRLLSPDGKEEKVGTYGLYPKYPADNSLTTNYIQYPKKIKN